MGANLSRGHSTRQGSTSGYKDGSSLLTKVFAGAEHIETAWRGRMAGALEFLLGH